MSATEKRRPIMPSSFRLWSHCDWEEAINSGAGAMTRAAKVAQITPSAAVRKCVS